VNKKGRPEEIPISQCARAYELRTCTDLTWPEIARALKVNRFSLENKVNMIKKDGYGVEQYE
jgi:hypothetical protein